jgi:RNA polymerase sigma-70 factor (ECF subfamily)
MSSAKADAVGRHLESHEADAKSDAELAADPELKDDRLRLLFVCCHPALARDAQIPLALKTLFGLGVSEIAGTLLAEPTAIAQRLVRAKHRIKDQRLTYDLPATHELGARLPAVLETLYLLYTEGYNAHGGDLLVKKDVCHEAMRLVALLAGHPRFAAPEVDALLALMAFHASRLDARTDGAGDLLLLEEQDRALWDKELIGLGVRHLERAMAGDALTRFHLEAGIAATHALAPSYAATDWRTILGYYVGLMELAPSPVTALNRAVAVAMVDGPEAGIEAVLALRGEPALKGYALLPGIEGELRRRRGDLAGAAACFRQALTLNVNAPERRWLEKRLASS